MAKSWGDLPTEIAAKIAEHMEFYDDYEAFSKVCSTWRLAIKQAPHKYCNTKGTQLPLLMLVDPDTSSFRRYYSLTKEMFVKIDLPSLVIGSDNDDMTRRYLSSRGWLISITEKKRRITLFNPFSKKNVIELPYITDDMLDEEEEWKEVWEDGMLVEYIGKFTLSATPDSDDYRAAMIFGGKHQVAFWKPGQDKWIMPFIDDEFNSGYFHDVCFFRGEFYAINNACLVKAFSDLSDQSKRVVADLVKLIECVDRGNLYLVELDASCLLVVHRDVFVDYDEEPGKYKTTSFKLFKVNVGNGKVEPIKTLGDRALFVGFNSTFLLQASKYGCKADLIYYTDDSSELYAFELGGSDIGIYDLTTKTQNLRLFYNGPSRFSFINPPMWIEFSEFSSA